MTLLVTGDGIIKYANPSFCEKFGGSPSDLEEELLTTLVSTEVEEVSAYLTAVSRTNQMTIGAMELIGKNGEVVRCKLQAWTIIPGSKNASARLMLRFRLRDPEHDPFLALNLRIERLEHEIRDRRRAQEEFRQSERRYRAIGEAMKYGVWTTDTTGLSTRVSASFADLIGSSADDAHDQWIARLHPEERDAILTKWGAAMAAGEPWDQEMRVLGVDGAWHPILCRGVPVRDDEDVITSWVGLNLDITTIKEVEQALMDANQRKDEFMAALAHELRNPLSIMLNALEVIREDTAVVGNSAERVGSVQRQVQHMSRLLDDLLDLNRIGLGKFQLQRAPLDLVRIVSQAVESSMPFVRKNGHRLETCMPEVPIMVDGDAVRLTQVITNLLTNAVKYTAAGGEVECGLKLSDGHAVLTVKDNGIGIPADKLSNVFEMFTQLHMNGNNGQSGLGIGLSLVQRIVDLHGGCVSAQSDGVGCGACFTVQLPVLSSVSPAATYPLKGQEVKEEPRRVVIVDDNMEAAEMLALLLVKRGHQVKVAFDGEHALKVVQDFLPEVVIMDIGMPVMDGLETCRRMRVLPEGRETYIIALSGWGQEEDRKRSKEAGFDAHLVKPSSAQTVAEAMAKAYGEHPAGS